MKRFLTILLALSLLAASFAGCESSPESGSASASGTAEESGAAVQQPESREPPAEVPVTFLGTDPLPPEFDKGIWKKSSFLCTGWEDLKGFGEPLPATALDKVSSLPVYRDKYPRGDYETTEEMKEEYQQRAKEILAAVGRQDLLEEELVPNGYLWEESDTPIFLCDFSDLSIATRSGGYSMILSGIPGIKECSEEELIALIKENAYLSVACTYAGITDPAVTSTFSYAGNGSSTIMRICIYQNSEDEKQAMLNRALAPIFVTAETDDSIVIGVRTPDVTEYIGEYRLLPYHEALNRLQEDQGVQNKDVLGYKLVYDSSISKGYYIPYYKFYYKESDAKKENVPKKKSDIDPEPETETAEYPPGMDLYSEYGVRAVQDNEAAEHSSEPAQSPEIGGDVQLETAKEFLEKALTAPNEGIKALPETYTDEELFAVLEDYLGGYVEEGQVQDPSSRLHTSVVALHYECLFRSKQITPKKITVTPLQEENQYSFEAVVSFQKEGEDEQELTIPGSLQFNEDGKISYVLFQGGDFSKITGP